MTSTVYVYHQKLSTLKLLQPDFLRSETGVVQPVRPVWFWPEQYFAKYIYHTTKLYQLYFVHKNRYKTHAVKLTLLLQSMNHQTKPSFKYFNFMDRFDCGFDTCLAL